MPFGRHYHEDIDAPRQRPYIAGHEQVITGHCLAAAPPPSQHGTDARSRVNKIRAAGFAALFPKQSSRGFGLTPPQA